MVAFSSENPAAKVVSSDSEQQQHHQEQLAHSHAYANGEHTFHSHDHHIKHRPAHVEDHNVSHLYSAHIPHHRGRRDSKVSVTPSSTPHSRAPSSSACSSHSRSEIHNPAHQKYLDSLVVPDHEMVERIAEVQEHNEEEIMKRRAEEEKDILNNDEERSKAAELIQRNYRGHRERRILAGMSLDPSSRWIEAVKEARYRQLTEPRARRDSLAAVGGGNGILNGNLSANRVGGDGADSQHPGNQRTISAARMQWKKVGLIARRAGGDEDSDNEISGDENDQSLTTEEKEAIKRKKQEAKMVRQKAAKMMDLQYFLEMVDLKHRYGSNLRTYHEEWKRSDTKENFFYWLDYGEGRFIDAAGCPRDRLEREQVRYLSKEERLHYLVKIDKDGRLCWAKNGVRIDTTQRFKDSIHGIVPATDETPAYRPAEGEAARPNSHGHNRSRSYTSTSTSSSSSESEAEDERADKYASPEFDNAKGVKKIKHVSAATIFNKLLRGSVKKNTWIFVADTSFRLYVGIKQSGAFQHSSFLHGSRISAAGLIKIKNGRLAKLSPLSGHYRPPVSNFRAFVHSLKEEGVDMSHVSISRSYAVLVGLEAYVKTRRRGKKMLQKLIYHRDKMLSPGEVAEKEEAERDKSQSAAKEEKFLEEKAKREQAAHDAATTVERIKDRLHISPIHSTEVHHETGETKSWEKDPDVQHPGTGPENAIAPEGTRKD